MLINSAAGWRCLLSFAAPSLLRTALLSTAAFARRAWRLGPVDAVKPLPFSSPLPTRLNPNLLFPPHFHLWLSPPLSFPPRAHTFMQFLRALPQNPHRPLPPLVFLNLVSANIAQTLFEHRKVSQIYCIIYISDLLKDVEVFYFLFFLIMIIFHTISTHYFY